MGTVHYLPARAAVDMLLTKKQLAERWSVSTRWIEIRVREDGLPMQKDVRSRLVRFSWFEVEKWRAERLAS